MISRRNVLQAGAASVDAPVSRLPNIVALVADDLSVSTLGCYGDRHVQTPNIDRLAGEGMRFNRAYVTSPQCSPSRSSLFTGRCPHATGMSRLHAPLRPDIPNVVTMLGGRQYYCGAYRKHHMGAGLQQQLDFYGDAKEPFETFFSKRPPNRPFFLWIGFTDPHRPYRKQMIAQPHDPAKVTVPRCLPDTPVVREDLALHYDAIGRLDEDCGRVLELLGKNGLEENTLVVLFGDNGMPYPRAKATLYQAGVRVPLLVRWPGVVKAGQVMNELVSLVDLPATWLNLAGAPVPTAFEGRSMAPLLTGAAHRQRRFVFSERNWHDTWEPARGVVSDRYSLIVNYRPEVAYRGTLDHIWTSWSRGGGPVFDEIVKERQAGRLKPELECYFRKPRPVVEMYDLERDPDEFANLAEVKEMAATRGEMLTALDEWMQATNDFLPTPHQRFMSSAGDDPGLERLLNGYLPM